MDKPKSNIDFKLMSFTYKLRDSFSPRINVLKEVGIKPGFHILDYGCGPGSYLISLAELIGSSGQIYALDIHPLAIEKVKKIASERGLINVKTILSDFNTGISDNSIDVVLLYDIFHDLSKQNYVLQELHRILKPNGILSFSDHHMREEEIILKITNGNLFKLSTKGRNTYTFLKKG